MKSTDFSIYADTQVDSSVYVFGLTQKCTLDVVSCRITLLKLTNLRIHVIICLRKPEVTVERILVCNVIEQMMEHGIDCFSCSYTNDVINMLP